jgi:hypothetical protein
MYQKCCFCPLRIICLSLLATFLGPIRIRFGGSRSQSPLIFQNIDSTFRKFSLFSSRVSSRDSDNKTHLDPELYKKARLQWNKPDLQIQSCVFCGRIQISTRSTVTTNTKLLWVASPSCALASLFRAWPYAVSTTGKPLC